MSGSVKSSSVSFANTADTGVSGNTLYHSLHAQLKRNESIASVSSNNSSAKNEPRKLLNKYYNLEGSLPADVSNKVFSQNADISLKSSSSNNQHNQVEIGRDVLQHVINDTKNFSKEQREQIARSVLTGSFEVKEDSGEGDGKVVNPTKRSNEIQRTKERLLYLQRHNLPKPNFLELATEAAPVQLLDGNTIRNEKVRLLRNKSAEHALAHVRLEPGLDWHNAIANTLSSSFRPKSSASSRPNSAFAGTKDKKGNVLEMTDEIPKTPMITSTEDLAKSQSLPAGKFGETSKSMNQSAAMKMSYKKLLQDDKMRKVKQAKEQQLRERERIKRQTEYDKLTIEKKTEIRKKIQEFRKQIKKYLIKKRDPLMGEIMRAMDDSLVYYLLEKYDGFSMSPEAILSMITNNLGQLIIDPVPIDMGTFSSDLFGQSNNNQFFLTETHQRSTDFLEPIELPITSPTLPNPEVAMMKYVDHAASLSAEMSYKSLVNNYRSYGRRSPPRSNSPQQHTKENHEGVYSTEVSMDSRSYSRDYMRRNEDPVVGYDLRRIEFDIRPPQGDKTLGSGFRTTMRPTSPEQRYDRSPSPYTDERGVKSPLMVLSSEHVKTVRKSMGFDPTMIDDSLLEDSHAALKRDVSREDDEVKSVHSMPSVHSTQSMISMLSNGAMSQATREAIAAMHEQLLEEGILPSLEPDSVLNEKQIQQLGLHQKSIDDILDELGGKRKKRVNTVNMVEGEVVGMLMDDSFRNEDETENAENNDTPFSPATHRTSKASRGGATLSSFQINSMIDEEKRISSMESKASDKFEKTRRPDERLMVFDEKNDLNHPPLLFHGATSAFQSQITEDKLRKISEIEVEKGERRLILPALRPMKSDKYMEFIVEFPGLEKEPKAFTPNKRESPRKGPMAIKTKPNYEERDGLSNLPVSPYKSFDMEMKVRNTGVPAGAGLMLWRPKEISTSTGRVRVGKQSSNNTKFNETKDGKHIPFVSAI